MSRPVWKFWCRDQPTARQEFDRTFEPLIDRFQAALLDIAARRRRLEEETRRARG